MSTDKLALELRRANKRWSVAKAQWAAMFYSGGCNAAMIEWLFGKRFLNQLTKDR